MSELRVVSWNVLHRTHGEKWSKHVIADFPDERERTRRISERVAEWLSTGPAAVCLQEVSGDQLEALGALQAQRFVHRYRRVPRSWRFWARQLADPSENLVTLVSASDASGPLGRTFENDRGKGRLAVEGGGGRLVNTPLPFGAPGRQQLKQAAALAGRRAGGPGGLNAGAEGVG